MAQTKGVPPLSSEDISGYLYDDFLDFVKANRIDKDYKDFLDDPNAYPDLENEMSQMAHDWIYEICASIKYYGEPE